MASIGRNDPCLCGSGKKYKKCCMDSGRFVAAFTVADSVAAFDAVEGWAFEDGPSEEEFDEASDEFHELLTDRQMDVIYDDQSPYGQPVQHLMAYWMTVERVRKNGRRGIDELLSGPLPSDRVRACLETLAKTPLRLYRLVWDGARVGSLVDVLSGATWPWPNREHMPQPPSAYVVYRLLPDGAGGVVPCPPYVALDKVHGTSLASELQILVAMGASAETPETEADVLRDLPPMAAKAWADFVCEHLGIDKDEHVHGEDCDHDDEELASARFTVPDAAKLVEFIDACDQFEPEDLDENGKPPSIEFGRAWTWLGDEAVIQLVDGVLYLETDAETIRDEVDELQSLLGDLAVFEDMDLDDDDADEESYCWKIVDEPGLRSAIAASPTFTPMDAAGQVWEGDMEKWNVAVSAGEGDGEHSGAISVDEGVLELWSARHDFEALEAHVLKVLGDYVEPLSDDDGD